MLKQKITAGLAITAIAATSLGSSAYAAGTNTQAAQNKAASCEAAVVLSDEGEDGMTATLNADENGAGYVVLKDNTIITVNRSGAGEEENGDLILSVVPAK